ncbi:MAG: glycerol-3-phosphate acyltransferase [Anaerolineales bacterium]
MGTDIRQYGDGNPGAFNVFRAGGKGWGWVAILLDGLKGAIPVGLANYWIGLEGWSLAVVALAPILGHAYSPLLKFRGGKALAVTFGVWTGLTLWLAPTILGLGFALGVKVFGTNGRAVMFGQGILLVGLAIAELNGVWMAVWLGMTILLGWKHRKDFWCAQ